MSQRAALVFVALAAVACEDGVGLSPARPGLVGLPARIDFGEVYVGGRAVREVTVRNSGEGVLRLGRVSTTDDVFATGAVPEWVNAGGEAKIEIVFAPIAAVRSEAIWTIETNVGDGAGETFRVALGGVGLAPLECDDDNACTDDTFDPSSGACIRNPREGACDDGSACTTQDRCLAGECVGQALDCDDGVACTRDLCDPAEGCVAIGDDTRCVDDDPCTLDVCEPSGCENPAAPDGHVCGEIISCVSVNICVLQQCVTVPIPDGAPCDDGDACTAGDQCTEQTCTGSTLNRPPTIRTETTMVNRPVSGTLAGDHLYISTLIADRERFVVMELDGPANDRVGAPVAGIRGLEGTAELDLIGADTWARVTTSSSGQRWVETVDTSTPDRPTLLGRRAAGYDALDTTATAVGDDLFFCSAPAPGEPPVITAVDVSDPLLPGVPRFSTNVAGALACRSPAGQYEARGAHWLVWQNDSASSNAGFELYRLSASEVLSVYNHGFNTAGISRYGLIVGVAMDEHRVIVDLENERYFFVLDLDSTSPAFARIQLAAPPALRLLTVDTSIAYFGAGDQVVAYDFADADQPVRLPDTVTVDRAITRFDAALAIDAEHLVLRAGSGTLAIFRRTATGLADVYSVKGRGLLGRITRQPSGLIGATTLGTTFVDPAALPVTTLAATPSTERRSLMSPHLLDGPDGPAGIFAPLLEPVDGPCSPFQWGCDRTQPTPLEYPFGTVTVNADGTATATATIPGMMTNEPVVVAAIDGCIGAGFDDYVRASRYVVVDRCRSPDVVELVAAIPTTVPPDFGVSWIRTRLHDGGYATFVGRGFAVLFDYRVPLAPVVAAERFLQPGASGGFLGAAFDGRHWVLTRLDATGTALLEVYEVQGGTTAGLGQTTFEPTAGLPVRNVLHLRWPLLYVGAEREDGAVILVYALDRAVPEIIHSVPLSTPAVDFVDGGSELYVARANGLTVLDPACGP